MKAIGIMSGTSLDGIDICVVNINQKNNDYEYNIDAFETFPYWTTRTIRLWATVPSASA